MEYLNTFERFVDRMQNRTVISGHKLLMRAKNGILWVADRNGLGTRLVAGSVPHFFFTGLLLRS